MKFSWRIHTVYVCSGKIFKTPRIYFETKRNRCPFVILISGFLEPEQANIHTNAHDELNNLGKGRQPNLFYDSIQISDENGTLKPYRYCNTQPPPSRISVVSTVLRVRFVSDHSVTAYGFDASYTTVQINVDQNGKSIKYFSHPNTPL